MTPDELVRWIDEHPEQMVPLVGAGLTIPAGAPSPPEMARLIAARVGLGDETLTLGAAARRTVETDGEDGLRAVVAEIVTGLRLRPTPAMTALCGTRGRRLLTTNYDDGLERAAASRGLRPVPLLGSDPRVIGPPGDHELQVVHLHGVPAHPESLVLPGASTNELELDGAFRTLTSARMAASSVVCFGFGLAVEETHLHSILRWLSQKVTGAAAHFLLLPADEADDRERDMEMFASYGNLTVVRYERDATHSAVERVAIAFAPRSSSPERVTWVEPTLLRRTDVQDARRPETRLEAIQGGWGDAAELARPQDLLEHGPCVLVAGPGMGKTTLIGHLRGEVRDRTVAFGRLRAFAPEIDGDAPEAAIRRLLERPDGESIEIEALEDPQTVVLLDGLDEVVQSRAGDAVRALVAATVRWPHATWAVTSRPGERAAALATNGFAALEIPASRAWARTYLQTRSVPQRRVEQAMLDRYGLGDLLRIPMFAERLADRLLDTDDTAPISPLRLLVDEQYAAAAREARRQAVRAEDMSSWVRALAVALELSGRVSAPTAELAGVPSPASFDAVRAALVQATLLADVPGQAEFPAKTLQEGLCADVLLDAEDPVALVHQVAAADLDGETVPRDDLDVTLDLVFEHAGPADRERLRDLDEQRWARTAARTEDSREAEAAFAAIVAFHAAHDLRLWWGVDGGLRSPRSAVAELVRSRPELVEARRAELEADLVSSSPSVRSRALTLLCMSVAPHAEDVERAEPWVLILLDDPDRMLVVEAAGEAGRLRLAGTRERLLGLLEDRDDRTRAAALRALIEIVDPGELPRIASRVRGDGLRPVAPRLLERCDLDTGLAVVAASRQGFGGSEAWMIDRLIETAHRDAWSVGRVRTLMRLLGVVGGGGDPDLDLLASALGHHPHEALAEVRLQEIDGQPLGSRRQLLALDRLDLDEPREGTLATAVERARAEEADIRARNDPARGRHKRWAEVLDAHGPEVDPNELEPPPRERDLQPRHHALLLDLVDRWWPVGPPDAANEEGWLPPKASAALRVGASLSAPLNPARWVDLLDAHLRARPLQIEVGDDAVTAWLADTYGDEVRPALLARLAAAADAWVLSRLFAIDQADDDVGVAAVRRLRLLGPGSPGWSNAVGLIAERRGPARIRALLDDPLTPPQRDCVFAAMARGGDARAQEEVLRSLAEEVARGGSPEVPHWFDQVTVDVDAAAELVDISVGHGEEGVYGFAIGLITRREDLDALRVLRRLAERHPSRRLDLELRSMSRRVARAQVVARLPADLGDLVSWVGGVAPGTGLPAGPTAS